MRHPIFINIPIMTFFLLCSLMSFSQSNDRKQILIFRNTGVVDLIFSDKLKMIENVYEDNDGNISEIAVSQRFITTDTIFIIPISEIDSVAFGDRNLIKAKAGARKLTDRDFKYIISSDTTSIIYNSTVPNTILPFVGEKIYYDGFCDIFPTGLCALTTYSERQIDGSYKISFKRVDSTEIFDAYFFAGEYQIEGQSSAIKSRGGNFTRSMNFDSSISTSRFNLDTKGTIGMKIVLVANVLKNYYHANIKLNGDVNLKTDINFEDFYKVSKESQEKTLFTTVVGGVLQPSLLLSSFAEFSADAEISYDMNRKFDLSFTWTKNREETTVGDFIYNLSDDGDNNSLKEATLKGTLFFGIKPVINLGILFNQAGAGTDIKIGPEISADFTVGILEDLSHKYEPELYSKAKLDITWIKICYDTYIYWNNFMNKDKIYLPFTEEYGFYKRTLNLFPELKTRAVGTKNTYTEPNDTTDNPADSRIIPSKPQRGVSIAATTTTNIENPLSVSFEMIDTISKITYNPVMLPDTIAANIDTMQGFDTEFTFPEEIIASREENIQANMVFKYKDRTIKTPPASLINTPFYSPVVTADANAGAYLVSGQSVIGSYISDENVYIIGNYVPVPMISEPFKKNFISALGTNINENELIGEYANDKGDICISFLSPTEGIFNGESFIYDANTPQTGDVFMRFCENRYLTFTIIEKESNYIMIQFKNSKDIITLHL